MPSLVPTIQVTRVPQLDHNTWFDHCSTVRAQLVECFATLVVVATTDLLTVDHNWVPDNGWAIEVDHLDTSEAVDPGMGTHWGERLA